MTHFSTAVRGVSTTFFLLGVSACTYIIPEEVSTPRYNTVTGERHKPLRNLNAPKNGAEMQPNGAGAAPAQIAMAAPVVPVAVNPLAVPIQSSIQYPGLAAPQPAARSAAAYPPVDPAVQARARELTVAAAQPVAAPKARSVPVENQSFIVGDTMAVRRAPAENPAFAVAQAEGLMNVPPRPVLQGADSPTERLNAARRDLEQARGAAAASKEQLLRDVSAEPSVFGNPAAVPPAPAVAPQVPVQPRAAVADPVSSRSAAVVLPPPLPPVNSAANAARLAGAAVSAELATMEPATTPPPVYNSARVFDPMAPLPPEAPAMKPIQLTPPGGQQQSMQLSAPQVAGAPAVAVAYSPVNYATSAVAGPDGAVFNPLEEASSPASRAYAKQHYLSPSRYSYTR